MAARKTKNETPKSIQPTVMEDYKAARVRATFNKPQGKERITNVAGGKNSMQKTRKKGSKTLTASGKPVKQVKIAVKK